MRWWRWACSARALPLPQLLHQLNLPRVIDVVRGDAVDHSLLLGVSKFRVAERCDEVAQQAMFFVEQADDLLPRCFVDLRRRGDPVAAFQRKGAALAAAQFSTRGVLPIRSVRRELL